MSHLQDPGRQPVRTIAGACQPARKPLILPPQENVMPQKDVLMSYAPDLQQTCLQESGPSQSDFADTSMKLDTLIIAVNSRTRAAMNVIFEKPYQFTRDLHMGATNQKLATMLALSLSMSGKLRPGSADLHGVRHAAQEAAALHVRLPFLEHLRRRRMHLCGRHLEEDRAHRPV